jgi:hypothetical protein
MKNETQQTAVEWFLDQLIEHRIIIVNKTTYQVKYKHEILLEQAKEMEKKQIEDAELRSKEIIIIKHTEHGGGNK